MANGKLRRLFPGGNTGQGFYSYYDYIIPTDARRIMVIKGGPGVGKSTFMKKVGEQMLGRGYDVEYHHCSSDNGSIDGIVVPAIQIAMIDGTAPQRVVITIKPSCPCSLSYLSLENIISKHLKACNVNHLHSMEL